MVSSGFLPLSAARMAGLGYGPGDRLNWQILGCQGTSRQQWWLFAKVYFNAALAAEPGRSNHSAYALMRFDSRLQLVDQIWLDDLKARLDRPFGEEPCLVYDPQLALSLNLDDGPILSSGHNRAFVFSPDGHQLVKSYDLLLNTPGRENKQAIYDQNLAWRLMRTPDHRLLCILGEQVKTAPEFQGNLIAVSEPEPDLIHSQPTLQYITRVHDWKHDQDYGFPYVKLGPGQHWQESLTPEPLLWKQLHQRQCLIYNAWVHQALPLAHDRLILSLFPQKLRGGSKGRAFACLICNYQGEILGQLELNIHQDSPFPGDYYDLLVDVSHGWIFYRNQAYFYLFDATGKCLQKIPLNRPEFKGLSPFVLAASTPQGGILLFNQKNHTLLSLAPLPAAEAFADWLADGLAQWQSSFQTLKRQHTLIKDIWWV